MKRSVRLSLLCTFIMATLTAACSAWAGGIMLYQFGSNDVGTAAAGNAARAQDASTVFTNPAGMSRLDKSQVLGGLQFLYGDVKFSPDSRTTPSGDDGGIAIGWMPAGSAFIVHKLNQNLSIGFGILSYFGLSEDYGDNWVGRYYVQKSTLIGLTLTPAVSYRVNNWLYLGAGLNMMYGNMDAEVAVNNVLDTLPDGKLKYDDNDWGYGGNFGILVEPKPGTRFGLTYLTEVKLDFGAKPDFSGLGPGLTVLLGGLATRNLDLSMTVPQMVMFSAYHELNAKWAVMGNLGWQDWSSFGKVDVSVSPTSLTVDNDYNDTWHVALGAQYRHSPAWTFTGGVAYDSSAVDDDKRTVSVPMGEVWGFGMGAQYAINPNLTLGAAYELAWLGDMSVDQRRGPLAGRVVGEYNDAIMHFFALNLKWSY